MGMGAEGQRKTRTTVPQAASLPPGTRQRLHAIVPPSVEEDEAAGEDVTDQMGRG